MVRLHPPPDRVNPLSLAPPAPLRPHGKPWPIPEASEFLCVAVRTMHRWIKASRIRVIRLGGRVFIPDSEVRRIAEYGLNRAEVKQ